MGSRRRSGRRTPTFGGQLPRTDAGLCMAPGPAAPSRDRPRPFSRLKLSRAKTEQPAVVQPPSAVGSDGAPVQRQPEAGSTGARAAATYWRFAAAAPGGGFQGLRLPGTRTAVNRRLPEKPVERLPLDPSFSVSKVGIPSWPLPSCRCAIASGSFEQGWIIQSEEDVCGAIDTVLDRSWHDPGCGVRKLRSYRTADASAAVVPWKVRSLAGSPALNRRESSREDSAVPCRKIPTRWPRGASGTSGAARGQPGHW